MQQEINVTDSALTLADYQQYVKDISKRLLEKYPKAIQSINTDGIVQLKSLQQMEQILADDQHQDGSRMMKGRGGNNVAENMKKSVKAILKKELSSGNYAYYEEKYIRRYHLKSQKQNYSLYFLFLQEMCLQGRIDRKVVENVIAQIRHRIRKYAKGSQQRMGLEPERKEFHEKNMMEFKKFQEIDLDFSRPRKYSQIQEWIRTLYLKKKAVYLQAERKVRAILREHPLLLKIFVDMEEINQSPLTSNSPSMESEEPQLSYMSSSE